MEFKLGGLRVDCLLRTWCPGFLGFMVRSLGSRVYSPGLQVYKLGGPPPCNSGIFGIYKDPNDLVFIIPYSHYCLLGGPLKIFNLGFTEYECCFVLLIVLH